MWTRGQLKNSAKEDLKGFYWLSIGANLLFGILGGGSSGVSGISGLNSGNLNGITDNGYSGDFSFRTEDIAVVITILVIVLLAFVFAFCWSAFVSNPARVGLSKFYVHRNPEDRTIGTMFSTFKKEVYMPTVKTMFMKDIIVFLWSMLFIIPGVIKSYAYRMVPYILNDHPGMDYKDALKLSADMTNGEKLNMWVLDLSFIGWELLAVLTCGLGMLFLNPYIEATWAQFYLAMCEKVGMPAMTETPVAPELVS